MRRSVFVLFLLIGFAGLLIRSGALEKPLAVARLAMSKPPEALPLPITGLARRALHNSWGAAREGGRRHEGIDIFSPKGTPVRSTTEGVISRVGQDNLGGNVVWIFGPGRQMHYYAHLERFGEFKAGDLVDPGDIIGYVGDTGNARGTPSHLHYGVYAAGHGAINPFPLLASQQAVSHTAPHQPS
jgi:murein DD-endopeptidase MepM/ murein hydrolase activator NlpD